MFISMLKAKIHQATVTAANLYYVGSITIDSEILNTIGILPNEHVHVVNNNNGARIETYVIPGTAGSKVICLNGAAARLFHPQDKIIILSYCLLDSIEVKTHKPKIVILDDKNNIQQKIDHEVHLDSPFSN